MSYHEDHVRSTLSGAASRSTPVAEGSFTPRSSPHDSRIPRWNRRSSQSPRNTNTNTNGIHGAAASDNTKGKRASSYDPGEGSSRASTPSQRTRKKGGFLLEPAFTSSYPTGQERTSRQSHRQLNVQQDKRRLAAKRVSDGSSQRSSPLSRDLPGDMHNDSGAAASARPPSMDPAQLVQMALSLSESRRRHVSSTLPVPISPAGARRAFSGLHPGSNLLQPVSVNESLPGYSNSLWEHASPSSQKSSQQYGDMVPVSVDGLQNPVFSFSPATLSRAEKARRYFELAKEHRRLLEHLPPLKTDLSAPGNYAMKVTSSPGSAHYDVTRVPSNKNVKRSLGRPYNPLQALRNRRLRNRERRPLTAPPDTWQETDTIKAWIDGVEVASKEPSFRPGEDQVRLPTFSGETVDSDLLQSDGAKRHRRNDTVSSVITRPENGWTIEPAELLADTYWVEKDDNKTVVEDRYGNRIFPNRVRLSAEFPRRSKESERRIESTTNRRSFQDENEHADRLEARRKNKISIPGRLRRHHVSRSASISSSSSNEGRKPPAFRYGDSEGVNDNIRPLERHMKQMISREEKGESSSPETMWPDHRDSKKNHFPDARNNADTAHHEFAPTSNGRLSADTQRHRRARSADGRVGSVEHRVLSMDDMASETTASPQFTGTAAMDPSRISTNQRAIERESKSRTSNLPTFRSRSKERNKIEHNDFADNSGAQLSPVLSTPSDFTTGRSSLDSSRPPQMKRNDTNESYASSMRRTNTTATLADVSIKDSASAMGRRLGRIGELVRTEGSRLGGRLRGGRDREAALELSSAPLDTSDAEGNEQENMCFKSEYADGGVSPRQSLERDGSKPKFHTSGLPTFKSPAARENSGAETSMSDREPPVTKTRSRTGTDRATPSDLPVPPTISIPDNDSVSDSDVPAVTTMSNRPKSASQIHLSFGASPAVRTGERRGNLASNHDGRRHWSISDPSQKNHPQLVNKITARDIARVRALLLASGIKAQEILNKSGTARDAPLPLMVQVAETTGQKLDGLTRKEENIVAGRLLSESISSTLSEFEKTLEHFQSTTAAHLGTRLEELSRRASDQLTKLVHETSDEVDAFNVELTTKQPQEVKRVDEAVDEIFRQRRRQFRLARRTGFKMLEWLVLGIMWWAWFVVVLFNTIKKSAVIILTVLRWLLWF